MEARKSASQATASKQEARVTKNLPSGGKAPRILIADDDPSIVRLVADHCARMGFEVDTAANGMQALLKANRSKPDILIIDVNMPEVDGLSVCAHLLDPDKKPMDVIVVTGSRDLDAMERCMGFGARYTRKGPNFWRHLEAALVEICPEMADRIRLSGTGTSTDKVPRRVRILLVDDDGDINRFLASRLEKYGVEVLYASGATLGFRMACREEPAVIIADYFMPNGDAQFLLAKLRTNAATQNIPLIVLTAAQLNDVALDSLKREICGYPGATKILRKSPDTTELFDVLEKFCGFDRQNSGSERLVPSDQERRSAT